MGRNANDVELAVARALRDSLEKLQHNAEEVNQAVGDLVSACASARPSNALPHIIRAQTASASLAASLEVLSRFITSSLHPEWRESGAASPAGAAEMSVPKASSTFLSQEEDYPEAAVLPAIAPDSDNIEEIAAPITESLDPIVPPADGVPFEAYGEAVPPLAAESAELDVFDVSLLSHDQQELHRRANRVAKVTMQDIKMLRPDQVRLGKENHDLCVRLRDDIERAHKEYDRRFQTILDHPVDYFYAWMVEILGEGDPQALGEYPYPSPVLRR
jgi:hypothetical protein